MFLHFLERVRIAANNSSRGANSTLQYAHFSLQFVSNNVINIPLLPYKFMSKCLIFICLLKRLDKTCLILCFVFLTFDFINVQLIITKLICFLVLKIVVSVLQFPQISNVTRVQVQQMNCTPFSPRFMTFWSLFSTFCDNNNIIITLKVAKVHQHIVNSYIERI